MSVQKNKITLLEFKSELEVISSAEEILEQKRNILLNDIMSILNEVDVKRKKLNELVEKSYSLLIKAFMESDRESIEKEANLTKFKGEINIVKKVILGIEVPDVHFKLDKETFPVSATAETLFLDVARQSFNKAVELILEIARIEIKAWKLSEELKKTVVRVNALKNHYMPTYEKEIKEIQSSLEESEREYLSVLKKVLARK